MPAKRIVFSQNATANDYASVIRVCSDRSLPLDPFVGKGGHPSLIIYNCSDDDEEALSETISASCGENAVSIVDW